MAGPSRYRMLSLVVLAPVLTFAAVFFVGLFVRPGSDPFENCIVPTNDDRLKIPSSVHFLNQSFGERIRYSIEAQTPEGSVVYRGGFEPLGMDGMPRERGRHWGQYIEQVEARGASAEPYLQEFVRFESYVIECANLFDAVENARIDTANLGSTYDRVRIDWNGDGLWDSTHTLAAESDPVAQLLVHLQKEESRESTASGYPYAEWHEVPPGPLFAEQALGKQVNATVVFDTCYGSTVYKLNLRSLGSGRWHVTRIQDPGTEFEKHGSFLANKIHTAAWDTELLRLRPWHDPKGGFINRGIFIKLDWNADGAIDEELWFFDPGMQAYKSVSLADALVGK